MQAKFSTIHNLKQNWIGMNPENRLKCFNSLGRILAEDLFLSLPTVYQAELITHMSLVERRAWLRMLPLDDVADVIQCLPEAQRDLSLNLLDDETKQEVQGLLAYAEDQAGGLMTPQIIRLHPDMEVEIAIQYLRTYAKHHHEKAYYTYVVDQDRHLLGVVSFRDLLMAETNKKVADIMQKDFISIPDKLDREDVARVFSSHRVSSIPVIDDHGRLKGVVTYDDIAHVIQEEATEDIQKIGGMEALGLPYWKTGFTPMIKKRAGWLTMLFLGEMLTATAMAHYEEDIERAVVLALFIPLIISSGGNSGSQASTLVIRAMALGEVKLTQ